MILSRTDIEREPSYSLRGFCSRSCKDHSLVADKSVEGTNSNGNKMNGAINAMNRLKTISKKGILFKSKQGRWKSAWDFRRNDLRSAMVLKKLSSDGWRWIWKETLIVVKVLLISKRMWTETIFEKAGPCTVYVGFGYILDIGQGFKCDPPWWSSYYDMDHMVNTDKFIEIWKMC